MLLFSIIVLIVEKCINLTNVLLYRRIVYEYQDTFSHCISDTNSNTLYIIIFISIYILMLLYCTLTNDILVNCIISARYICTKINKIVQKKRIENGFLWLKSKKFKLIGTSYESQPDFQKVRARLNPRWIIGSIWKCKKIVYFNLTSFEK